MWNPELERIAQRWTDQCKDDDHDVFRSKLDGSLTGQNAWLGISYRTETKEQIMDGLGRAVDGWYNEVNDPGFTADDIDPFV